MSCPNYYPLVSASESETVNLCFVAVLLTSFQLVFFCPAGIRDLWKAKVRVGSLGKQSFSYRTRTGLYALYNVLLVLHGLFSIKENVFYALVTLGIALTNAVILLPLLVFEALFSIIPHGSLLLSTAFQGFIFAFLAIQNLVVKDGVNWENALEVVMSVSVLTAFILEFKFYSPSVELWNYYLQNGLPTNVPDVISQYTFSYMNQMMVKNHNNPNFSVDDAEELPLEMSSNLLFEKMDRAWTQQYKYKNGSLILAWAKVFGANMTKAMLVDIAKSAASYAQPLLFRVLILWLQDETKSVLAKLLLAFAMFLAACTRPFLFSNFQYRAACVGMGTGSTFMRLIFNKTMRLSQEARNEKTTGQIISLFSVDSKNIQFIMMHGLPDMIVSPLEIFFCVSSLYFLLGKAMWSALAITLIAVPIQTRLITAMKVLQDRHLVWKDSRTAMVSELLGSIRSVKLYSWEPPLMERLEELRNEKELGDLRKKWALESVAQMLTSFIPYAICCGAFYLYSIWSPTPLTADIIFPSISLFRMLGRPIRWFPDAISDVVEAKLSFDRIRDFMLLDEFAHEEIKPAYSDIPDFSGSVSKVSPGELMFSNAKFLWSLKNYKVALKDIDYSISKNQLLCVVGKVGSGKTAFLKAILGELPCVSNDGVKPPVFDVNGSVAYCSQTPWIMNTTVKQNVLFNKEFDQEFYELVLEACDLNKDIAGFEDADETLVGEKGISLSGGQKARISLARALYSRADIYVLDDILSAVDSHVSAKLIQKVFHKSKGLLANKTTILATNNIKVLNWADDIVLLENNTIAEHGSYESVTSKDGSLGLLIKNFGTVDQAGDDVATESDKSQIFALTNASATPEPFDKKMALERLTHANNAKGGKRYENSNFGKVDWTVYKTYFKACGKYSIALALFLMCLSPAVGFLDTYWLKHWADVNAVNGENTDVHYFISVFALIALAISIVIFFGSLSFQCLCAANAAKVLHHEMTQSIVRAPMSFFEKTPLGRILNRFTGDINNVDVEIALTFRVMVDNLISILVIIVVVSYNIPPFLIFVIALSFLYRYYQKFYVAISREIKRLNSISKTPVMSHIGETINGDETVRAYGEVKRYDFFMSLLLDNSFRMVYNNVSASRWIAIRLEAVGAFVIFTVVLLSIVTQLSPHPLETSLIALIVSYTLDITNSLNTVVRMMAIVESEIVSVERIMEYSDIPSEAPLIVEEKRVPPNWPEKGEITFQDYSAEYVPGQPVLKNLSFTVEAGTKVGIVGRTGAGKSTLAASIFRLIEPASGTISIDGVVLNDIGLYDLRHNLNIIPQDSQALQGTVRHNLDPFSRYTDDELLKALELSHFDKFAKVDDSEPPSESSLLNMKIVEGGSNLSVGQKQLLCLARALLSPSRILILDEATAAVDVETDTIIQETIRTQFADRTIITIAHRLDTILDYDKALVLDFGEIKEYDTVSALLANHDSLFYKMCEKGGYV